MRGGGGGGAEVYSHSERGGHTFCEVVLMCEQELQGGGGIIGRIILGQCKKKQRFSDQPSVSAPFLEDIAV